MPETLTFILVDPGLPENIGAATRALKTMGLERLRLVRPAEHLGARARWMAHGANDVLERAEVFESLEAALADVDFALATTARDRHRAEGYVTPDRLPNFLVDKGDAARHAALVFGSEQSGLPNRELALCDALTTVPLAASYPSLNLAQAVMVYAYALSPLQAIAESPVPSPETDSFRVLRQRVEAILGRLDVGTDNPLSHRLIQRLAQVPGADLKLLHFVLGKLEPHLNKKDS